MVVNLAKTILVVSCVCIPIALISAQDRNYASSPNPHIRLFANVLKNSVWPRPDVFVCWENLSPTFEREALQVRSAITESWEKESRARFIGWTQCAPNNAGIRIRIEDSGPHTKGLGRALDRKRDGMVLNFEFNKWSNACGKARDFCIKGIAVHEFGHALGFAHEQNRFDAPGECQQLRQGTKGDLLLTPYDPQSVMNYCNPKYNNNGELSALDIAAVREIYGQPSR